MLLALAAAASPVDRQKAIVAEAAHPCRRGYAGEIVVCGDRPDVRSPYRLPVIAGEDRFHIDGPVDSVSREHHKTMDEGGAGAQQGSCSATGASGSTGCLTRHWREAGEQAGFRSGVHVGPF